MSATTDKVSPTVQPSSIATRSAVKNNKTILTPPYINNRSNKRLKPGLISEAVTETLCTTMAEGNTELLEQNLATLYNQESHSNKDIIGAIMDAQKITNSKLAPMTVAIKQITVNSALIKDAQNKILKLETKNIAVDERLAILEQSKLECQASITGFKIAPDESAMKFALMSLFGIDEQSILRVQSFSIKTKKEEVIIITNIYFSNTFAKGKVMAEKIKRGQMKASNFFPSLSIAEGSENIIFIGHKLTKKNLEIRKALNEHKSAGRVINMRFRNSCYQTQLSRNGQWKNVASMSTLQQLISSSSEMDLS